MEGMDACDEKIEGDMGVTSHWMPQSVMLAGAERVFRFEECMSPEEGRCPRPRGKGDQMNVVSFCGQSITRRRRSPSTPTTGIPRWRNPIYRRVGNTWTHPCYTPSTTSIVTIY